MRKIIVSEFLSLDGVMEGPGPDDQFKLAGWTTPYFNGDIAKFKFDELFAADALLLGRITYQGFAKAWPERADEAGFANRMNSLPKFVVSTTLERPEWRNSTLIKDNVAEEISKLKQQPGQDILVGGSSVLVQTLMQRELVDKYQLLVYPVVLGTGKRLFKEGTSANLELVATKKFDSGVVLLSYQPAKK
jgi:dihydrofolate reductase